MYITIFSKLQLRTDIETRQYFVPSLSTFNQRRHMYTVLLIILILLLVGALPTWPYSTGWGYYPSGGLGLVLVVVLVLVLMGRA